MLAWTIQGRRKQILTYPATLTTPIATPIDMPSNIEILKLKKINTVQKREMCSLPEIKSFNLNTFSNQGQLAVLFL